VTNWTLSELEQKVVDAIREAGEYGLTDPELVAAFTDWTERTVRRVRRALYARGLVRPGRKRDVPRRVPGGKLCMAKAVTAWVAGRGGTAVTSRARAESARASILKRKRDGAGRLVPEDGGSTKGQG
jgi:hypothetical protein